MPEYSSEEIRTILKTVKAIALVGISLTPSRPSVFVLNYLLEKGYDVYPVNPLYATQTISGRLIYGHLSEIPHPLDMVDIFRGREAVPKIMDDILALSPLPRVVWMQLGVIHEEQALRAEQAGLRVIMDRCPKMEYGKLSGEWGWIGGNTGILSSRRQISKGRVQSLKVP